MLFSLHLALTHERQERGFMLRDFLMTAVRPVQGALLSMHGAVTGVWSDYINLIALKKENDALRQRITALTDEKNRLMEEASLNSRLKQLLEFKDSVQYATQAAGVTGYHMDGWSRSVTINKGVLDDIRKDRAVITPDGVAGRTIETNAHTARVLLTTDPRSNIDVLIQRTRVQGVAEGNGGGITLKYIRQYDDAAIGDIIVTSGISGLFPKGLIIGEIVKIEKGKDNFFKHIEIRPGVDFKRLEEVLVVQEAGFSP